MDLHNADLGQGAQQDPNIAAQQQDAQHFHTLTNLAHLISGSGPEGGAGGHGHQAGDQQIATHDQGTHEVEGEDGPAAKRMKLEEQPHHGDGTAAAGDNAAAATATPHPEGVALPDGAFQMALDPAMLSGLTAEQLANLQQGMPIVTPEMLAAAMQTGPDGQPIPMQLPMLADMSGQFPATFDPAALGMAGVPLAGMDVLQQLPPEQLQAFIQNPNLTQFLMPGGFQMPPDNEGNSTYKNWWDEKDEQELMRMVSDTEYRREKLGTDDLDWAKLETYFNRSQNALRKKFWVLSKGAGGNPAAYGISPPSNLEVMQMDAHAMASAAAAAAAAVANVQPIAVAPPSAHPRQRAERKNWSEEETNEMVRIVSDANYRFGLGLQLEGEDEVSWERLGAKFGCTVQTAKRKYRHLQEQAAQNNGIVPEKKKREHYRKSVPYRWMIVSALSKIPGFEATAPQIFESIEMDPELRNQLDVRIMPGTKHVPRWKIQIRKVLSADHIFINTGVKQKHETIWRLDPVALQEANADRQRQRAGVPPINLGAAAVEGAALPAAPPLAGTGTDAMAALQQMQMSADQTMALLQSQQLMLGMQPGQAMIDGQQVQIMQLPEGTIIDPATLAAMMANQPGMEGAVAGVDPNQQEQQQQQGAGEEPPAADAGAVAGGEEQHGDVGAAAVAVALGQDVAGAAVHQEAVEAWQAAAEAAAAAQEEPNADPQE